MTRMGFTLMEMLVALALLLVLMGLAGQVFKIALDGTGRLTQLSEIDRSIRMFEQRLGNELASIDPAKSIMAIQANPAPAYWSQRQKERDDDGNVLNGNAGAASSVDPLRENPTLGYDPLDNDEPTDPGYGSFDASNVNDDYVPQLPRADILMFVANLPDEKSKVFPDVKSDGPVMIVYNHAEIGELIPRNVAVDITNARPIGQSSGSIGYNNDSTDDWVGGAPRRIPQLQPNSGGGPVMDPDTNAQTIAQYWHLARRAILLKSRPDPLEVPAPGASPRDRFAHMLSPTNPAGNQTVGFIPDNPVPQGINAPYERHYLNWIQGGEMDVVSPIGAFSGTFPGILQLQDFNVAFEVTNRYFGGLGSNDVTVADGNGDNIQDNPGAVMVPRNAPVSTAFYRGAVPAWWLARSQLDPEPAAEISHRLAHFFLPNCASFKVEWTPNDVRLEQAGLPEILWVDPFREPGVTRDPGSPVYAASTAPPLDGITPSSVQKPNHLDEFEILAQKMTRGLTADSPGTDLQNSMELGAASFGGNGSLLYQVHQSLKSRFGLSLIDDPATPGVVEGVQATQANVFDADLMTPGVQPSYNTHSWYAKDVGFVGGAPRTSRSPDPMWPKALRVTIDLFDDAGVLEEPVRHVFVVPIGAKSDRKQRE